MDKYLVEFTVNGKRTEQTVSARSQSDAKELVKSQYSNCKISIFSARVVR